MSEVEYRKYTLKEVGEYCVVVRDKYGRLICTSHTIETAKETIDEREASFDRWERGSFQKAKWGGR